MTAHAVPPVCGSHGLLRVGGLGLISFAVLYFGRELLEWSAGPPPRTGADVVAWITTHQWLLGMQSEVLFFSLMCLVPAIPGLYDRLKQGSPVSAALGCGALAVAVPVLAMLDILQGRFAFPVYGIRVDTPAIAAFTVAVFYGGLHSVQLMLGFAIIMLTLAMRRSAFGTSIRWGGAAAAAAAILGGYPWVIGPSASLALQAGVTAWWVAVGWALYHTKETS